MKMDFRLSISNCFLLITIIAGLCSSIANAQRIVFGRKLDVYIIKTIITVSADSCMDECNKRNSCGSINYHRLKNLCELNSKTSKEELDLSFAPGYVFKKKVAGHVEPCDNLCGPDKVCRGGDKECEFDECTELHVINGIGKGNMKNIGSKSIVNCNQGYEIEHSLSKASCEQRGSWTFGDKLHCKKICERPKDIDGGTWMEADLLTSSGAHHYTRNEVDDLLNETILSGSSYITYKCEDDLQMYGLATIKCEDGEWSKPPVCFYRPCRLDRSDESCPEQNISCSDTVCNCVKDVGNFSIKICASNCSGELDWFPETNDTKEQQEEEVVNEGGFPYISPEKCEKICNRAREFACDSLNPRIFNFIPDAFDESTCMIWSNSFRDRSVEKIWWTETDCPFKA